MLSLSPPPTKISVCLSLHVCWFGRGERMLFWSRVCVCVMWPESVVVVVVIVLFGLHVGFAR